MKVLGYLALLITVMLLLPTVSALGITGNCLNCKIRFEPDLVYPFSYSFRTNSMLDASYEFYAKGALEEYVVIETEPTEVMGTSEWSSFKGFIDFPSELKPGWHRTEICVRESCPEGTNICARVAVCGIIRVQALHPMPYPQLGKFDAYNINEGQPITFKTKIDNIGEGEIIGIGGKVNVYNNAGELLGSTTYEPIDIPSAGEGTLIATFETKGKDMRPADYSADTVITYEDFTLNANTTFKIGSLNASIVDYTKELTTGGIKRFVVSAESGWNDPLDVFSDIIISKDGEVATQARSITVELDPWKTEEMEAFIDTSDVTPGEYDLEVELNFADKRISVKDKINISALDEAVAEPVVTAEEPGNNSMMMMTIALIAVVLLLTMVNLILVFKRKKED